jgi:hypothetical protein
VLLALAACAKSAGLRRTSRFLLSLNCMLAGLGKADREINAARRRNRH